MEVVTREYKVYNYSELSEDAKEKAKQWYLDHRNLLKFMSRIYGIYFQTAN